MHIMESPIQKKSKFNRGFHFVITSEGGTNHDPVDRGGITNWGISEKQYPDLDIDNLTLDDARHIYYRDYWLKNKCDKFSQNLSLILFDCSVNCGQPSGGQWLQRACNKMGSGLIVDGIIGRFTLLETRTHSSDDLQSLIISERIQRYVWLFEEHPEQRKYIKGWLNRVSHLLDFSCISNSEMFTK